MCHRNVKDRNKALKMHKNDFCLIWKPIGFSFNEAIEKQLKLNSKIVDSVVSDEHVESFSKYDYKPEKVQSQFTNMIVYDIETFKTIKCVPYSNCNYIYI